MLPTRADLASKSTTMDNNSVVYRSISIETPPLDLTQSARRALYKDGSFTRKSILPNLSVSSTVALSDGPVWPVTMEAADLPSLPIYFEKNCSTVIKKTSPSEIARRIVICLHRISAAALICEGNPSMKVTNMDQVEYIVSIFKTNRVNITSTYGTKHFDVLVEVQRRRGDSLSFHSDCRNILDAAAGESTNNCSTQFISLKVPPSIKCPLNSIEQKKIATESLHNIASILGEGSMLDETVLGMERLCSLTNPLISDEMASMVFSNMPQEILQKIRNTIIFFRKQPKIRNDFIDNFGDIDEDWEIPVNEYYSERLLNESLKIMSNLIRLGYASDHNNLIPSLLDIMKNAACQPQEAYHACQCLGAILQMNNSMREELLRNDALNIVEKTQHIGKCGHLLLELESERIFNRLVC
mmetsp:Transcript_38590/g.44972  ORF Transcript_38590/g.44972 Transcript_38590/m.44972 type:complete len:413 (-) Transcript_38590:75-1313(-)